MCFEYCRGQGSPNNRGKCPFQKIIKRNLKTREPQNALRVAVARNKEGPIAQEASMAHQTVDRGTPPRSRSPQTHDAAPTPLMRALNALARRGRLGQRRIPATPAL
jgi:hypothetical protein